MQATEAYDSLRSRIAQAWTAMFFCVTCGFLNDLILSAATNDFSKWEFDPGTFGLKMVSVVMTIYIFMPILIRNINAHWFRWFCLVATVFFGLFFVAHQVAHALTNTRPFNIIHIFDFAHHILVVWTIVLTARWARQARPDIEFNASALPQAS
ncbi:MAG: hypothetical protein JWN23_2391 [Rhodocyclales bacterium]|nr:hypothetical protein [Rhodocyclales bacterium]